MTTVIAEAFRDGQQGKTAGALTLPVDFDTPDTIEGILVDDTDLSSPASPITASGFDSQADVKQGTPVSAGTALTGVVVTTPGIFDAADMTGANAFPSVTGDAADNLCLVKDNATEANGPLIVSWYGVGGLPVTPNGGDIEVTWNASGILQI